MGRVLYFVITQKVISQSPHCKICIKQLFLRSINIYFCLFPLLTSPFPPLSFHTMFFFFCAEEVFTTFCVPFWRFIKDVLFFIFIPWYCFTGFTVFILLFFFFSTLRRCRSKKFNRCQPKPVHLLFNIRTPYYYTKDILYKTWWIMFSFIFFWPVAL